MFSLLSAYRPFVVSTSSPRTRTTVAVFGGSRWSLKIHTPAVFISCSSADTSRMIVSMSTDGGGGASGW